MRTLHAGQKRLLARIPTAATLPELLRQVAELIESVAGGAICTVLLLDDEDERLALVAAPGLPASYVAAIRDGIPVREGATSCGTAAFRREAVLAADIASDPAWAGVPALIESARRAGLEACWSTPILSAEGRVLGTVGMYHPQSRGPDAYERDLIEVATGIAALAIAHKGAEAARSAGPAQYRDLYTNTPAMLHSIDQQGRLVAVSSRWLEVLGYEREEVLGRRSIEFLTPASRKLATDVILPEFFRVGACQDVPYQFVKKNGELVDVLLSATAERDAKGAVVRSLAVLTDVTENRAEEALRAYQRLLQAIIDNSTAVIYVKDLEGRFLLVNRQFTKLFAPDGEPVIGRTDYDFFPAEHADGFREMDAQVLAAGHALEAEEIAHHPDGPHTYISIKSPLLDDDEYPTQSTVSPPTSPPASGRRSAWSPRCGRRRSCCARSTIG